MKPTPTPGLSMKDPIAELAEQIAERERENKQLMEMLKKTQDDLAATKEVLAQTKESIRESQRGMTPEDIAKARKIAGQQQAKEIQEMRAELKRQARELLIGERLSFKPWVDDKIPYGSKGPGEPIIWVFEAGKEAKYPRIVIKAYEDRQKQLGEWTRMKKAYGAAGPGYASTLSPIMAADFTGSPRRPSAEHEALLEQHGIQQTLEE